MKKFLSFVFILSLGITFGCTQVYGDTYFSRDLKYGMSGEDVRQLQRVLNRDNDTRIQAFGPGSVGQETDYFGMLTHSAVIRFQEKYRGDILLPNRLISGTGFVGPSTRAVLNRLDTIQSVGLIASSTDSVTATVTSETSIGDVYDDRAENIPVKSNIENIDTFFSAIDAVAQERGIASGELSKIKDQIWRDLATTTDLKKLFEDTVRDSTSQTINPTRDLLHSFIKPFISIISPSRATAATGMPFGGAVLFPFFCTCSANWLITITPLPPTFVVLLSYMPGSQAFLSYNIPFTTWLLGEYIPGAGVCLVYVGTGCAPIPSEGLITPMVGSSPL